MKGKMTKYPFGIQYFRGVGNGVRTMFINCYNGYGLCLFSVIVKDGVEADRLADHIYYEHELIDFCHVTTAPEGAVVRY